MSINSSLGISLAPTRCHAALDSETLCQDGVTSLSQLVSQDEPTPAIAIVGMAMRLPGGVTNETAMWQFLMDKKDAVGPIPGTRYNIDAFYNSSKSHSIKTKSGYFLAEDPAYFDAGFFGINQHEASRLDPQQRLLLEVVWECMEGAGQVQWRGANIGCYVGVYGEDWLDMGSKDTQQIDRYHVLGTGNFALSNRVSYEYDLTGPSVTIQSACSSSTVGLHNACQDLYSGDCSGAIVAGTNLILSPTMTTTMSDNLVMAPDGTCKTFDQDANGYGRGEAINAVYIKLLEHAVRDGDPIRAVIRSTAINCDGKTRNITVPSTEGQKKLICQAYQKARIQKLSDTGFFECHGTGTVAGDTAEVTAVADLLKDNGMILGATKANFGHSEGASGLTSLIKSVMILEHMQIPPNAHLKTLNPCIPFEASGLHVPTEPIPFPINRKPRISLNSFGIGGSNAHVILDSAASMCPASVKCDTRTSEGHRLIVVSAASHSALKQRIADLKQFSSSSSCSVSDLAYTLGVRREHLVQRAFAIVESVHELSKTEFEMLEAKKSTIAFIFTGQGAQWARMGQGLMENFGIFANTLRHLDKVLQTLHDPPAWSITEELFKSEEHSNINDPKYSQPLCSALQIALIDLLRSWDIVATSVVGHSSGEIAAAYAANAITADVAIILAYYRGQVSKLRQGGVMAAVGASPEKVKRALQPGATIACENSPRSTTISGDRSAVEETIQALTKENPDMFCRLLKVNVAYHSHHMLEVSDRYRTLIEPYIQCKPDMRPMFSTVTGKLIINPSSLNAEYWAKNLESPVLFSTAIQTMIRSSTHHVLFMEIGPHSALSGPFRQNLRREDTAGQKVYIPTLVRQESQVVNILQAAGRAHASGYPVRLQKINDEGQLVRNLPSYPWEHNERYWHESRLVRAWRGRSFSHHELLGSRVTESSDFDPSWRNILRVDDVSWVMDHQIFGDPVFPAAGYVAMAGEAIRQLHGSPDYVLRDVSFQSPLFLDPMQEVEVVTSLNIRRQTNTEDSSWYDFSIASHNGSQWVKHCQGRVQSGTETISTHAFQDPQLRRKVSSVRAYDTMARAGLSYGERFKCLQNIRSDVEEHAAAALITDDPNLHDSEYSIHPIIDRLYVAKGSGCLGLQANGDLSTGTTATGSGIITSGKDTVLLMENMTCIALNNSVPGTSMPLATTCVWKPAMELLHPSTMFLSRDRSEDMQVIAKLTAVYILEAACLLRGRTLLSSTQLKYQTWIVNQAAGIADGSHGMALGDQEWASWRSDDRLQLFQTFSETLRQRGSVCTGLSTCLRDTLDRVAEACNSDTEVSSSFYSFDQSLNCAWSAILSLSDWKNFLHLMAYSTPQMRVMVTGPGAVAAIPLAMRLLTSKDEVPLYSQFDLAVPSEIDIAPSKKLLTGYADIGYRVLDTTRDPSEQNLELKNYHLIIGCGLVSRSATPHITLQHTRRLLCPGGRLLLQELCSATMVPSEEGSHLTIAECILGLEPESEADCRQDVVIENWDRLARETGFSAEPVVAYDNLPPYQLSASILLRNPIPGPGAQKIALVYHREISDWGRSVQRQLQKEGYVVCWAGLHDAAPKTDAVIFILDLEAPTLYDMSEGAYSQLKRYIISCRECLMIWVTHPVQAHCSDPRFGLITGFSRSLRCEGFEMATLEVDTFDEAAVHALLGIYELLQSPPQKDIDRDYEFLLHEGTVQIPRFQWTTFKALGVGFQSPCPQRRLAIGSYGQLDTLHWQADSECSLQPGEVEVEVEYSGLNFRDLMVCMGLMGSIDEVGVEGSGIIRQTGIDVKHFHEGDRVMFLALSTFRTRCVLPAMSCIKIPEGMSTQYASTFPVVFATAIYSLINIGNLQKGQSVLIHSACGGVGLASIQVCQLIGAEIYATVGNEEKVDFLTSHHGIPRDHIFYSRSDLFLHDLMKATEGAGVDIVLNSLAGDLLHTSWECVAKFGKMIELGKRDFIGHSMLDMHAFGANRTFCGVDLMQVALDRPQLLYSLLQQVSQWFQDGKICPVSPLNIFDAGKITEAFRFMQKGTHKGKILVKLSESEDDTIVSQDTAPLLLNSDATYLLVGGLGNIGKLLSIWMAERGARELIFLSRSSQRSQDHLPFLCELEAMGCHAILVKGDVSSRDDVKRAVKCTTRPIEGVMNLSMVLHDQSFDDMPYSDWITATSPKVSGTVNLHDVLSHQASLKFFVLVSSVSGLCGNMGQVNYAAANTFLDAFVQYRRGLGLPASVLNLGPVTNSGDGGKSAQFLNRCRARGIRILEEEEVHEAMKLAILRSYLPHGCLQSHTLGVGLSSVRPVNASSTSRLWGPDARFSGYQNIESKMMISAPFTKDGMRELIQNIVQDPEILLEESTNRLVQVELGKMLTAHMAQRDDMTDDQLIEIAIDSLMSIEIRNWLRRVYYVDILITDINKAGTVGNLGTVIMERLKAKYLMKDKV
ncbi:hypothetical protein N7528_003109 [Penicillium herquei]|nr:hypothetical protein N7528_003109 [Penicillium herquei]